MLGLFLCAAEHLAALAVVGLAIVQLMVNRGACTFLSPSGLPLAWWLMNLIAGLFFSPDPFVGIQNAIRLGLLTLTFILVLDLIPDRRYWYWAVAFFLIAGVLEAAFGTLRRPVSLWHQPGRAGRLEFHRTHPLRHIRRRQSVWQSHRLLGGYCPDAAVSERPCCGRHGVALQNNS